MVIEPLVRMGPPPRSLAPEANDCFMVRLPRGPPNTRLRRDRRALWRAPLGLSANSQATAAQPRHPSTAAPKWRPAHTLRNGAIPFRYVTENRACHKVANPPASTPSATPNDRHDIAPAARPSNRFPRSVTVDRRTDGPEPSAGNDTVAELVALQAEYAAWHDALPDSLRDSATAEALQAIVDLDIEELMAIVPPHGYGRDGASTKSGTHTMKSA